MSLFCLIHGSSQNSLGWNLLTAELEKQGHKVLPIDLPNNQPGAGATYYAQIVAEALKSLDTAEKPILVAHSASGLLLPVLPSYCEVERLIFLAAAIPQVGKSFLEQLQAEPDMLWPDWIGKDPTQDKSVALHYLFHDCSPEIAQWALTTLSRMHFERVMTEPCPISEMPPTPISYIVCSEDRTARPDWCRRAAKERLGVTPIELPGGHCPYVSRPKHLAAVLAELASAADRSPSVAA